jgi:hypothetical protein
MVSCGFANPGPTAYLPAMPSKPIELPPSVAKAFVKDMRIFLATQNTLKQDEIAVRQLHALKQHHRGELRLSDVKQMFLEMRATRDRLDYLYSMRSIDAPILLMNREAAGGTASIIRGCCKRETDATTNCP